MALTTILVVAGIAAFLYLLTPVGPTRDRSVPFESVHERTSRLAIMREGDTLTIFHRASGRRLLFTKAADEGGLEQELVLRIREGEVDPPGLDLLRSQLAIPTAPWRCEDIVTEAGRSLVCHLRGQPLSIAHMAAELLQRLRQPLSVTDEDRFEVTLDGVEDYAIWQRVNSKAFIGMTQSSSPLARWYGRRQLRRQSRDQDE